MPRTIALPKFKISAPAAPNPFILFLALVFWPTNANDPSSDQVEQKAIIYTNKTVTEILSDATFENETGNGHKQYKKEGGMEQAERDFDDIVAPGTAKAIPGGRRGQTSDGNEINVRDHSSFNRVRGGYSGDPTVEITNRVTGLKDKIRYPK